MQEFLKLKPLGYDSISPSMDLHQFLDQIASIRRMLGCNEANMIKLVRYQLDDVTHYWFVQHIELRDMLEA